MHNTGENTEKKLSHASGKIQRNAIIIGHVTVENINAPAT